MRFSAFSDYSLRVLMHLGSEPGRRATIGEIAAHHGISQAHLMKVVHQLALGGYIESLRGKGGGIRLGRDPAEIVVGEVLRRTESDLFLAECFSGPGNCRLQGACHLQAVLDEALQAMFLVLDGYTLADLLPPAVALGGDRRPTDKKNPAGRRGNREVSKGGFREGG